MDPDATATMACNDDFTELMFSNSATIEIRDDKEFCQKDTSMLLTASLIDLSEEMGGATISVFTTYTKVPSDEFVELVAKEFCVNGKVEVDAAMMMDSDDYYTSMMESCTAIIGHEIYTCSVCENNEVKLSCPTLGFNTEGGCTSMMGDGDTPSVMRGQTHQIHCLCSSNSHWFV